MHGVSGPGTVPAARTRNIGTEVPSADGYRTCSTTTSSAAGPESPLQSVVPAGPEVPRSSPDQRSVVDGTVKLENDTKASSRTVEVSSPPTEPSPGSSTDRWSVPSWA